MKKITSFFLKTFITIISVIALFFVIITTYLFIKDAQVGDRIYPHVHIDHIDFGGKTIPETEAYFQKRNGVLKKATIQFSYKDNEIATFSGTMISLSYDPHTLTLHAASIGRSENFTSKMYQKVKSLLNLGRFNFPLSLSYDLQPIEEFLDSLEERYNKPAENALFNFENGKVTAFQPEKEGVRIKKDAALAQAEAFIKTIPLYGNTMSILIADEMIKPEISLSSANNFGIVEMIGQGVSDFSGSIPGRIHNLTLASSRLNGVLIPKGETFSFNQMVGDISAQTGYKPAYIIKSGRTVLGDGGGVCQVSTTLFRAALNTGLPIVERVAHAYRVHYYENGSQPGFDATVFNPSADLKIKNDTPAYILIQTAVDKNNNKLTFTLYGKKDDRVAEISNIRLWDVQTPPQPFYQDDPTLKKGVKRQVDWSAPGGKASFHYKVTRGEETIADQDFYSSFRPWRAVYLVGTAD